jgi:hypothetical protein
MYVDDIRFLADEQSDLVEIEATLRAKLPLKSPPAYWWLGSKVSHDREAGTLTITQRAYIESLLKDFGMLDCSPVDTPAIANTKLCANLDPELADKSGFNYRGVVGSLLWLARLSRPDILYAVNQLGAHAQFPISDHVQAAKRVLRYLKGTMDLGITLHRAAAFELAANVDADFAGEPEDSTTPARSLTGMVAYVRGVGPIYAHSSIQSTIAKSTAEAEYKAITTGAQFCSGLRQLLEELGFEQRSPTVIKNDNEAAIVSTRNRTCGSKLRHVKINFHYVKELVKTGEVTVTHCPTQRMVADIFTKALARQRFQELRDQLLHGLN